MTKGIVGERTARVRGTIGEMTGVVYWGGDWWRTGVEVEQTRAKTRGNMWLNVVLKGTKRGAGGGGSFLCSIKCAASPLP